MFKSFYTYRTFLTIPVPIFAGQAVLSLYEGHLPAGIVIGSIALLILILLLSAIYKNDSASRNKTMLYSQRRQSEVLLIE